MHVGLANSGSEAHSLNSSPSATVNVASAFSGTTCAYKSPGVQKSRGRANATRSGRLMARALQGGGRAATKAKLTGDEQQYSGPPRATATALRDHTPGRCRRPSKM